MIISTIAKKINNVLKAQFAQYVTLDNYGTEKHAWTFKGAYAWLAYTAPCSGRVVCLHGRGVMAARSFVQAY